MNILHVNMSLDPVTGGGTVERVRQLHAAMQVMDGIDSRILSIAVGGTHSADDVTLLPSWNKRWYLPAPWIWTMLREVRWADVIIMMNHWTILNAIVYGLARLCKKSYMICPAGALPLFGRSQLFKRFYNAVVGRALIVHADASIAIAADESEDLQRYGVAPARIHHIPNGVRSEDFSVGDDSLFRGHVGLHPTNQYLLFVGRLNTIKGPDLLLEAFLSVANLFPELHLVFVGPDGGMQKSLEKRVAGTAEGARVHFAGFAGGELKSSAYHGASLLVVPSRQEAMSIVALEAAVSGTPVIMTNCCGFDALADAGGAMLVETRSDAIAEALRRLVGDARLRQEMGQKGQQLAMQEYTWTIAAERHVGICRSLLRESV